MEDGFWSHNNSIRETYTSKYRPWSLAACFEARETRDEEFKQIIFIIFG